MLTFNQWVLKEFGGTGGPGGGLTEPVQRPDQISGAWADYHDQSGSDPKNPNGQLPPVPKKKLKKRKINR